MTTNELSFLGFVRWNEEPRLIEEKFRTEENKESDPRNTPTTPKKFESLTFSVLSRVQWVKNSYPAGALARRFEVEDFVKHVR